MREFKFGWHGDQGLGEEVIEYILAGKKTASIGPAYDPVDAELEEGEEVLLVNKNSAPRGVVRITRIELRPFGQVDAQTAEKTGVPIEELKSKLHFANSRQIGPEEEMRIIHFQLVSAKPPKLR